MAAVARNKRQKRTGSSFSNRKSSVSSRMLKAKMSPNQSGWLSMALMRKKGKVTIHVMPMRKYQKRCFTCSICPTFMVSPASSTSSMGRMLNI